MYISLWENYRGHPDNISFMQFSTKIDGFEQKDSQGFENSYNSYEQYPLEKFFIFTIYQNYTLALIIIGSVDVDALIRRMLMAFILMRRRTIMTSLDDQEMSFQFKHESLELMMQAAIQT